MKVICIDNQYINCTHNNLTLGKVYDVLAEIILDDYNTYYCIKNDKGVEVKFYKTRFKVYNPIDKLKALIGEK